MGFVLRTRVERAKALLARGDVRVGEVAAALGFADHGHLTRTFRRLVGTSPARFSRAQREPSSPRARRGRSRSGARRDRGSP
jgi:AraC family transcriptional regulator